MRVSTIAKLNRGLTPDFPGKNETGDGHSKACNGAAKGDTEKTADFKRKSQSRENNAINQEYDTDYL